jgi:hypothetical protein
MSIIQSFFEPLNYNESKGRDEWERAMNTKHDAHNKNNTWVLEEFPQVKDPFTANWFTGQNIVQMVH